MKLLVAYKIIFSSGKIVIDSSIVDKERPKTKNQFYDFHRFLLDEMEKKYTNTHMRDGFNKDKDILKILSFCEMEEE